MYDSRIWLPLILALAAGLFTSIGSLVPFLIKNLKRSYLQFSLGLSAGVLIYVSLVEILTKAIATAAILKETRSFLGAYYSSSFSIS